VRVGDPQHSSDLIPNLIVDDSPSPTERGEIAAFVNGTEVDERSPSGPPSAYVFKTTADPFADGSLASRVDTGIVRTIPTCKT
jgi:translation elongation factor EF-G